METSKTVKNKQEAQPKQAEQNVQRALEEQGKKLTQQQKTIDEYTNQLKRLQAEFENYVKRNDRERASIADCAVDGFLAKLLVVVDDFHQALGHVKSADKEEVIKGIEMIFAKLHKLLESEGIREMNAKGKTFDPHFHEVLLSEETASVEENTVLEELQKGYLCKDRVLRYAKVKIAKKPKEKQFEEKQVEA